MKNFFLGFTSACMVFLVLVLCGNPPAYKLIQDSYLTEKDLPTVFKDTVESMSKPSKKIKVTPPKL
jgi:hypothetical protein